jgi:hypothetical protein
MNHDYGFGRVIRPDVRNNNFRIFAAPKLEIDKPAAKKYHHIAWQGNQGSSNACVGFTAAHLIENGPVTHGGDAPIVDPFDLYAWARELDEFPGNADEGTSALGVCKAMQQRGMIGGYYWGKTLDEVLIALSKRPVMFGQAWYEGMFTPNAQGFVVPEGSFVGYHETLLVGHNIAKRKIKVQNSWGEDWGDDGCYWLTFENFEALLADYGDACFVDEFKKFTA